MSGIKINRTDAKIYLDLDETTAQLTRMNHTCSLPTVSDVVASLTARNVKELALLNTPNLCGPLGALVNLTYDGRRVRRNHDLIDALKRDARVTVGQDVGVHFADVVISLR